MNMDKIDSPILSVSGYLHTKLVEATKIKGEESPTLTKAKIAGEILGEGLLYVASLIEGVVRHIIYYVAKIMSFALNQEQKPQFEIDFVNPLRLHKETSKIVFWSIHQALQANYENYMKPFLTERVNIVRPQPTNLAESCPSYLDID